MARAKVSFKSRGKYRPKLMGEIVIDHPEDVDLAIDLREIVQNWRYIFSWETTRAQDLRATLRAVIKDDDPARALESAYETLHCAVSESMRTQSETEKKLPLDERMRLAARLVLKRLPRSAGGRPSHAVNDVAFAVDLCVYWIKQNKIDPSVTIQTDCSDEESEFVSWCWEMFSRAGREIKPVTLAPILRNAYISIHKTRAK